MSTNILVIGKFPHDEFAKIGDRYKGVDRMCIDYPVEFHNTNHEILRLNDEYEKLTEKDCYIHDINFAKKLCNVYNQVYPKTEREIIEVVFGENHSALNGEFLGYDIIDCSESNILRIILSYSIINHLPSNPFRQELLDLAKQKVLKLNKNKLFDTFEDAALALSEIEGCFQKHNETSKFHKYEVAGIYAIQ